MGYTRVTVLGTTHKADLVLPDDEPVGSLVPQLLQLLGENIPGGQELSLSTLEGNRLDLGSPLSEQDVAHGSMLRLTTIDGAPHAPEVTDVTDALALTRDDLRDRWTPRAAAAVSALIAGVLCLIASNLTMPDGIISDPLSGRYHMAVVAALLVAAVWLAWKEHILPGQVVAGAALGAMLPLTRIAFHHHLHVLILSVAAAGWLTLGLVVGVGRRRRSALVAAALGILSLAVAVVAEHLAWDPHVVAVVTVVVALVVLGLLPGIALSISGLTRYDDQSVQGERPPRGEVQRAILEGFSTLTWTVIAVTPPTLLALLTLVDQRRPWALWLTTAVGLTILLRARILPLIPQKVALFLAGGGALLAVLINHDALTPTHRAGILAAVVLLLIIFTFHRPSAVVAAKFRRAAEILELLLLIAVVPLTLATLGIFADLLEVFR